MNIDHCKIKLKNMRYNVVPPIQKHNTNENIEYPFIGSDEEKNILCISINV